MWRIKVTTNLICTFTRTPAPLYSTSLSSEQTYLGVQGASLLPLAWVDFFAYNTGVKHQQLTTESRVRQI